MEYMTVNRQSAHGCGPGLILGSWVKGGGKTTFLSWMLLIFLSWPRPVAADVTEDLETHREEMLALVNEERQEKGLEELTLGEDTVKAAQAHADDMLARHYFAHESPEGATVQNRYMAAGGSRWKFVAENIAHCADCVSPATEATIKDLHEDWMNSPPHRENILAAGLSTFGFGLARGPKGGLHAVQTFAGPGVARGTASVKESTPLSQAEQGIHTLAAINNAREKDGVPELRLEFSLRQAAEDLLPSPEQKGFGLSADQDLLSAIPEDERRNWSSLSMLSGACGGCGTKVVGADIRYFVQDWRENPSYRASLLDPQLTHLGFAFQSNGKGRKIAVVLLGIRR